MVMPQLFNSILDSFNAVTGSPIVTMLIIIAVFVIGFMLAGIDFKFALMFCMPLLLAASTIYLPGWITGVLVMLLIGVGGYMAFSYLTERL